MSSSLAVLFRKHWFFLLLQLVAVVLGILWVPYSRLPLPGFAVAVIAVLAAMMSVQADMRPWEKFLWLLLIGAFVVTELRAIRKDRDIANKQSLADRLGQDAKFDQVFDAQDKDFKATIVGLQNSIDASRDQFAVITKSQQEAFDKTMAGIRQDEEAVIGTKTYAFFVPTPISVRVAFGQRSYELVLFVKGKYPLRGMSVTMGNESPKPPNEAEAQFESENLAYPVSIPVQESDFIPGEHFINKWVVPGNYMFMMFTAGGVITENLKIIDLGKGKIDWTVSVSKGGKPVYQMPPPAN